MKNITLSADALRIERARAAAARRHTTLNQLFREWLLTLDVGEDQTTLYERFMKDVGPRASPGPRTFTREDMNER